MATVKEVAEMAEFVEQFEGSQWNPGRRKNKEK